MVHSFDTYLLFTKERCRQVTLTVSSSLSAHIRPQQQTVDAGAVATFNCTLGGGGEGQEGAAPREVSWLKDARPVVPGGRVSLTEGGRVLTVHGVTRTDRGMYQCLVRSGEDNAQGSAELSLGGIMKLLIPLAILTTKILSWTP